MSDRAGAGAVTPPTPGHGRRWLPFWVIQATEIGVAVVLADVSIHVSRGGVLVAGAFVFFALAVTADGPLGLVRVCRQRLHLVLVVVAAVVLCVVSLLPTVRPDIEGLIVIGFVAVGLIRLATLTQTGPAAVGTRLVRRSRPGVTVIDTTATVAETPPPADPTGGGGPAPAREVSSSDLAARWAGRATSSAAATGKRAAAKYGPVAGTHLRRTIRAAGRAVGSATSSPTEPKDPPPGTP